MCSCNKLIVVCAHAHTALSTSLHLQIKSKRELQKAGHRTAAVPLGMAESQEALLMYLWYLKPLRWDYTHVDCICSYEQNWEA